MDIKTCVRNVPIFSTLSDEEIEKVISQLQKVIAHGQTVVFDEGDPGDAMYLIATGAVRVVKMIDGTNEKLLAGLAEGQFFGEMALLDGDTRSAKVITTRNALLFKLSRKSFETLMASEPSTALKIMTQLAAWLSWRLRSANLQIAELENWRLLHEKKESY